MAFGATHTFLAINGVRITADAERAFELIDGLHEPGTFQFDRVAAWLRANTASDRQRFSLALLPTLSYAR